MCDCYHVVTCAATNAALLARTLGTIRRLHVARVCRDDVKAFTGESERSWRACCDQVYSTICEEAFDPQRNDSATQRTVRMLRNRLLDGAKVVYCGYQDDPRATDNAWVEATVVHVHCPPELGALLRPCRREDKHQRAVWVDLEPTNSETSKLPATWNDQYAWFDAVSNRIKIAQVGLVRVLIAWGRIDIAESALYNPELAIHRNPVLHIQPAFQDALIRAARDHSFNVDLIGVLFSHGATAGTATS